MDERTSSSQVAVVDCERDRQTGSAQANLCFRVTRGFSDLETNRQIKHVRLSIEIISMLCVVVCAEICTSSVTWSTN